MTEKIQGRALIRVVDDDADVRKAVRFLLENEGWSVKVFESGEKFLEEERLETPGCVILDVRMTGISGLEVHKNLNRRGSQLPVIFLTAHGEVPMAVDAMKAGASEFLMKPLDPEKLLELVEKHAAADLARRKLPIPISEALRRIESLTRREKEVLSYVLKDLSNREISDAMNLSIRTVECHRLVAYKKLSVRSRAELEALLETALGSRKDGFRD